MCESLTQDAASHDLPPSAASSTPCPGTTKLSLFPGLPVFGGMKIVDAATGILEEGETEIAPTKGLQPWPV